MYRLSGKTFEYEISENGLCTGVYSRLSHHQYLYTPDFLWRLIYAEGVRTEIPVWSIGQVMTVHEEENALELHYASLQGDGRELAVEMRIRFEIRDNKLQVSAWLANHDSEARIMELFLCPVSGVRTLTGNPEKENIAWPKGLGMSINNPAFSDLSAYSGFRKYEKHDQFHSDLCNTYPARLCMQWFDWYTDSEGLYVGSHDTSHHTISMSCEREVKTNTLRMGVNYYPMLENGEKEQLSPIVIMPHLSDWHEGAKIYRRFVMESGLYTPPVQADWAKDAPGWLRLIFKQHHLECNFHFRDIPRLYDEVEAAGMNILYLLGWEEGGFARMWPDFVVDKGALGGVEELRAGIEYVHGKGGKILMFLSYSLLDHESDFYKNGAGEVCTVKTIWNTEVPFAETYCGEGTYRKMLNPPMPMYLSCPGSDEWQKKMIDCIETCMNLGSDGVLLDLGGLPPYFCYDKRHHHQKPSHSCEQKADRFAELKQVVKKYGKDKIILMEHNVDVFNQHMDIIQPGGAIANPRFNLPEMYRYTFPELILTNREYGEDETDYRRHVNRSAALGLRYDMTIFRCCGTLSDLPHYTAYLTEINELRRQYAPYLMRGKFRDQDGLQLQGDASVKGYVFEAEDGSCIVLCWNDGETTADVAVSLNGSEFKNLTLAEQSIAVVQ